MPKRQCNEYNKLIPFNLHSPLINFRLFSTFFFIFKSPIFYLSVFSLFSKFDSPQVNITLF